MKNRCEIEILLSELEMRLQNDTAELAASPEGRLYQVREGKNTTYKRVLTNPDGKRIRLSMTKNPQLVMALARKEYLKAEIDILSKDIKLIQDILTKYRAPAPSTVLASLPRRFQSLPEEWFFSGSPEQRLEDELARWAAEPYHQSDFKPEKKNKRTSRGLLVRSMGEVACAEQFYYHDVAFRYEQVLVIEGFEFAPDFTIKRPRDGKIIYWEHCGKPYDEGYMRHHKWKLEMYEKAGIVPWDNLIVTYSDENNNSDVRIIQSEIINKLL